MKISKIDIKDFGKFSGSKIIEGIDTRIALFYGENEAGKTTIFNLIKAMFYGFYPAKSENHPYSSWENGRIEFTTHLNDGENEEIIVYRKLLSKPNGSYSINDRQIKINNDTLPYAKHVSKELYDKIYALRVEDLIEIQGTAWDEVEDKLLANYGTDIIKNTRDILKELRSEYDRLWKNDRRTKTIVRELEKEKQDLKKSKKEILQREYDIRKADIELYEINIQIKDLDKEKIKLKTSLEKERKLAPVKKILLQIDILKNKLSNNDIDIPNNIRDRIEELKKRIGEIDNEIIFKSRNIESKENEKYLCSSQDELVIKNKSKIRLLSKKQGDLNSLKERLLKLKDQMQKTMDGIIHESSNILTGSWDDSIRQSFERINKSGLQILVGEYRKTQKKLDEATMRLNLEKNSKAVEIKFSKSYLYILIIGITIAGLGVLTEGTIMLVISAVALIYGVAGIMSYINMKKYRKNISKNSVINNLEREINELKHKLDDERTNLEKYLSGIPLSAIVIEKMDDMFLPTLIKIKDLVFEFRENEEDYEKLVGKYNIEDEEIEDFLNQFTFNEFIKKGERIFVLEDKLEDLEKKKLVVGKLDQQIKELNSDIYRLKINKENMEKELNTYIKNIEVLGDGDIQIGLDRAEEIQKINGKIESLEDELSSMPEVEIIIEEINSLDQNTKWIFEGYEVTKAHERLESINERLNSLREDRVRLEEKINNLWEGIGIDEIESRLEIINEDLEIAKRKRDRLALLYEIIKFADQKFREENQPDVLKKASKYLEIITNGKYIDLFIEESDSENVIAVKQNGSNVATSITDTFSKGTLNQLFLALRLSLIDHLDNENTRLPICFDELLVNWDEERLESSLKLIHEISKKRQIFMFTCHQWLAEKIEDYFQVKRIEL